MKSKIVCLVLSLVFIIGVFGVNGTSAWFIDYESMGDGTNSLHNFKSGKIDYVVSGGFKALGENERIQPEMELLDESNPFLLTNRSSIDTELRIKVYYTYFVEAPQGTEGAVDGYLKVHNYSTVGEGAPFVAELDSDNWTKGEALDDDWFYYNSKIDKLSDNTQTPQTIELFTSLKYSGENSILPTTAFKDSNEFKITVVFQAKQANFAEWVDVGEIVFNADGTVGEAQ